MSVASPFAKICIGLGFLLAAAGVAAHFSAGPERRDQQAGWVTVNSHPLYYEVRGQGHPLVMLHGGGDSVASSFSKQLQAFSRSHRIIAPEQIGQGHTPDTSEPLTYTQMMQDTAALLEQLKVRNADVVGWSDGGILALMLAAHYPDLVRRVVISGVNISPEGLKPGEIESLRSSVTAPAAGDASIQDKLNAMWLSSPTASEISFELLKQVNKPVLVMAGDHDVIRLDHTLQIYQALPRAELYILPNTSHRTFSEQPQLVNPVVLRFLDKS